MQPRGNNSGTLVASFYRFVALPDHRELREPLRKKLADLGLSGTILLAGEGINGTLAGPASAVRAGLAALGEDPRMAGLETRESWSKEVPFLRLRVRLKREIVSLGIAGIDPASAAGIYVDPDDWNALIADPGVRVVDTRNDYEVHLGTFAGAEDPGTRSFREFPGWVGRNLDPVRDRRVALFCTGGIRCEKATALLRERGFAEVYHLRGGILGYLETVGGADSCWRGECFVFDDRVSVDAELCPAGRSVCPACRLPLEDGDRDSPLYEENVCCPRCHDRLTPDRRNRLRERARQVELARQRGQRHLGQRFEGDD